MKTQNKTKTDTALFYYEHSDTLRVTEKVVIDTSNGRSDTTTLIEKEHFIKVPVPKEIREQDYGKLTVIISILLFTAVAIYKRIKDKDHG